MITAWIAGMLSDRLGRRKVFVWISTAVFALGTYMLIHIESVTHYYLLEILLGAAKAAHILTPTSTVRRIVNMTALAVVDAGSAR